ncbi:aa3-type cytochrome c oxidase subunit IV [uncultured Phenylobacterium sp.]|uniref:aa3-type cytochrome c oxidase subunit IV n=1 Tax=uncultured Phenylobacterium sp. TaxID=349273 RepID=UPI0025F018C5|nr:aa3-type cytochrome c oxidase subunit IV [uncultured Phenylobacterium sp.]
MAGDSSDYQHGAMDVSEQQATFHLVMGMTKWGSLVLAAFLFFVVLWFCTPAGFLVGALGGIVVMVAGVMLLREKPAPAH